MFKLKRFYLVANKIYFIFSRAVSRARRDEENRCDLSFVRSLNKSVFIHLSNNHANLWNKRMCLQNELNSHAGLACERRRIFSVTGSLLVQTEKIRLRSQANAGLIWYIVDIGCYDVIHFLRGALGKAINGIIWINNLRTTSPILRQLKPLLLSLQRFKSAWQRGRTDLPTVSR